MDCEVFQSGSGWGPAYREVAVPPMLPGHFQQSPMQRGSFVPQTPVPGISLWVFDQPPAG